MVADLVVLRTEWEVLANTVPLYHYLLVDAKAIRRNNSSTKGNATGTLIPRGKGAQRPEHGCHTESEYVSTNETPKYLK